MSTTVDSLAISVGVESSDASKKIIDLATSLKTLKSSAGLTTVTNNLTKLSNALKDFNSSTMGMESIKNLAKGLSSLGNVNGKGISSILTQLKKLPTITSALDDDTISNFKMKMDSLTTALTPLSEKINKLSTGFSRLPSYVKNASKSVDGYNKSASSGAKSTSIFDKAIGEIKLKFVALVAVLKKVANYIADAVDVAKEIDGVTVRFNKQFSGTAEGLDYAIDKVDLYSQKLNINKQSMKQYMGIFGTLANGFGVSGEKVTDLSLTLTQMGYDLYASSNDMYTLEEAMNAVRSAISGEIEPIRRAGISITEAMLQQTAAAHGIEGSVSNMTESQKMLLRTLTMQEQFMKQQTVGTYANELDTAEGALRSLKEQMKSFSQALGTVFLPLINAILPPLTAMVNIITELTSKLATLFGYKAPDNNETISNVTSGAEDASGALDEATDSAKKLKNATMGFDELNVISDSSSTTSDTGNTNDLAGIEFEDMWANLKIDEANEKMEEYKTKIQEILDKLWEIVGGPLVSIETWLANNYQTILGLAATIGAISLSVAGINAIVAAGGIGNLMASVTPLLSPLMSVVSGVQAFAGALGGSEAAASALTFICPNLAEVIGNVGGIFGATGASAVGAFTGIVAVIGLVVGAFITLYNTSEEFRAKVDELVALVGGTFKQVFKDLGVVVKSVLNVFKSFYKDVLKPLWNLIVTMLTPAFNVIVDVLTMLWKYVIDPLATAVSGIFAEAFSKISQIFTEHLNPAIKKVIDVLTFLWEQVLNPIVMWIWDKLKPVIENVGIYIKGTIDVVKNFIITAIDTVTGVLGGLIDFITGVFTLDFGKAWEGIKDIFASIINGIIGTFEGFVNLMIHGINFLIGAINCISFDVPDWVPVIGGKTLGFSIPLIGDISLPRLEDGGLLSMGQMFIARENGPEMVGNFGNKTGVINNDQIVESVSNGVYQAVVRALGEVDNNNNVHVYLDGDEIYSSVKNTEKSKGVPMFGSNLGYGYGR